MGELIIRAGAVVLAVFWTINLVLTARRPPDWYVESQPNAPFKVRFTRNAWLTASTVGLTVAFLLFVLAPRIANSS